LGLPSHQQLSLALADKLAFPVTTTASLADAAALADQWGVRVDDSTLHTTPQAEARTQAALLNVPAGREPERTPTPLAGLMLDGWPVRQRRPGWGRTKTQAPRVLSEPTPSNRHNLVGGQAPCSPIRNLSQPRRNEIFATISAPNACWSRVRISRRR
jgi:hypothetical protein